MEHRVACDAVQGASRQIGGVDHTVFDHKNVFASTFGHEAGGVEQQRFVVAFIDSFHVGQNRVGVVAHRLGLCHGDVHMMAREAGSFDANATLQAFFAQVSAPSPCGHHQVDGVAFGADTQFL